jgi:hypothetical protein
MMKKGKKQHLFLQIIKKIPEDFTKHLSHKKKMFSDYLEAITGDPLRVFVGAQKAESMRTLIAERLSCSGRT